MKVNIISLSISISVVFTITPWFLWFIIIPLFAEAVALPPNSPNSLQVPVQSLYPKVTLTFSLLVGVAELLPLSSTQVISLALSCFLPISFVSCVSVSLGLGGAELFQELNPSPIAQYCNPE